jgi:alkylglycerol monooxygenase
MLTDMWRTRRWRDKAWMLLSRTGWRPLDVIEEYPRPKTDLSDFHRYDPETSKAVKLYALAQLMVLTVVGVAVLFAPDLSYSNTVLVVAAMALSMVCTSQWLDVKDSAMRLDVLRLLALLVATALIWNAGGPSWLVLSLATYCCLNALALPWLSRRPAVPAL